MCRLNCLRMEKAYKGWGSELTTEITMIEAGLERFVDFDKAFKGRDALLKVRDEGPSTCLVYCVLDDTDEREDDRSVADPLGNEACSVDGRVIGVTTSGAVAPQTGRALLFAYVEPQYSAPGSQFGVTVLGQSRTATVLDSPVWDAENARLRS